MYAADELTVERAEARKASLEHERKGYVARIAAKKAGRFSGVGEDLTLEQLDDRVKQVDAEIKSATADVREAKKKRDGDTSEDSGE